MDTNISRALRIDSPVPTREREDAARERVAQYYDTRYGSDFGAMVRTSNDFDF